MGQDGGESVAMVTVASELEVVGRVGLVAIEMISSREKASLRDGSMN